MRHLTILDFGSYLGVQSERIIIKNEDSERREIPFSRVRSITIAKGAVSLSAAFLIKCSIYGIRLFILDRRRRIVVGLSGVGQEAVVELRRRQFQYLESEFPEKIMRNVVRAKIRNQRAVLLYFYKYISKKESRTPQEMKRVADELMLLSKKVKEHKAASKEVLRNSLMGYEGRAAAIYWECLREMELMPKSFARRTGRGADDPANQALNLGYAILQTYVWNALLNAGLEIYAGFLHSDRPGKPSLVLDMMEAYRPWVVDRNIIKLRSQLARIEELDRSTSREVVASIHKTFARRYYFKGKKLRLETILQRQAYRLAGEFCGKKSYYPYLFKW